MKEKTFTSWSVLWLVTAVLFVAAGALNISQRGFEKMPPTDGVHWVARQDGVYAERVLPGYSGARAGISTGDRLIGIGLNDQNLDEITSPAEVQMYLDAAGVDGTLTYYYQKTNYTFSNNYYFADLRHIDPLPRWTPSIIFLAIVGLVWLIVGAFVLFQQGSSAPFVLHFATVCLAAFIFHILRSIGTGKDFDLAVDLMDNAAFAFFVPLFVHFCIRYPVRTAIFSPKRWKTYALYVPAALLTVSLFFLSLFPQLFPNSGLTELLARLSDRFDLFGLLYRAVFWHFVAGVSAGGAVLVVRFFRNRQPMIRQRLKWAMWGTVAAIVPVLLMQLVEKLAIPMPGDTVATAISTLPLALIPLSFGHSVVRYRLMDVDVVVRRALVYTLTTLAISMMIGAVALGLVFLAVGSNLTTTEITLRAVIAIVAMGAIVLISEPLKKWLQERADRFFYGERYDLRQGLLDFGRTLSATTALDPLLDGLIDRLRQVLDVEKVAIFIEDESARSHYRLAKSVELSTQYKIPADFRTMIRQKSAERGIVRIDEIDMPDLEVTATSSGNGHGKGIHRQELHYFVP
ncbi:MAG: hypothetical protein JO314_02425, partial [Acidobacteria bacterium]|nr:hypothetical protein [Acidobacteriota bacterium]